MSLEIDTLDRLRRNHAAWRLLCSNHAPLIASFLYRVFIEPNVRVMPAVDLTERLEDELFALRERDSEAEFPLSAAEYLNDWASMDKGWLRKFYRAGTDEAQFDITPATEKAIRWLVSLTERSFVGTESRLRTLFSLLEQIDLGTETNPMRRIEQLEAERDRINDEIVQITRGEVPLLQETAVRDRFQQFQQLASALLSDFREVEHNFRQLDRRVRERIALWEGSKGELLEEILGERDAIANSDQGRSFRAFWEFLMSSQRQEELTEQLQRVLALPAVAQMQPDSRARRVHYDWLEAGESTQRTVAQLSQQLRRFLDEGHWAESRRVMQIMRSIEAKAIEVRDHPPEGPMLEIDAIGADIYLPLERPLFTPNTRPKLADLVPETGDVEIDTGALFSRIHIDKAALKGNIRQALASRGQITLQELLLAKPLKYGLAELVAYLQIAHQGAQTQGFEATVYEGATDPVRWITHTADGSPILREARMARVIFSRPL
ncbi:MAG: DUF3375 domain-containing protein [Burkholderiaceae bacterium]|nr:DUF3375 domain-containing protein [Burkholderiaceae bacterium]